MYKEKGLCPTKPHGHSLCSACAKKSRLHPPAVGVSAMDLERPETAPEHVGKPLSQRTVCGPGKPIKARRHEDILNADIPLGKQAGGRWEKARMSGSRRPEAEDAF